MLEREQKINMYKTGCLAAMILGTSSLHYLTSKDFPLLHDVYLRFYFIPVALGGVWFGLLGGLGAATAVALLYAPHVILMWNDMGRELANRVMDIFLIYCIGVVIGYSADTEHKLRVRWQQATRLLKESYEKLRQQADLLLETEGILRRADRLTVVGQLTADFAHEIRNPLSSIKGAVEILKDGFPEGHPKIEFMDIISKETMQLNHVVEDFLDLARSGKEKNESGETTNLSEATQETAALLKAQFRKHDLTIQMNIPDSLYVKGSPVRIKQVLLNLLLNAAQAAGDGGLVIVSVENRTRKILLADMREGEEKLGVLTVEDSGPGLSPEAMEKAFQPFFTTKEEGTGLGLTVSRRIVTALGGSLTAENREEGGARFTLSLPLAEM